MPVEDSDNPDEPKCTLCHLRKPEDPDHPSPTDTFFRLACRHGGLALDPMHSWCLDKWIQECLDAGRDPTCPICRSPISAAEQQEIQDASAALAGTPQTLGEHDAPATWFADTAKSAADQAYGRTQSLAEFTHTEFPRILKEECVYLDHKLVRLHIVVLDERDGSADRVEYHEGLGLSAYFLTGRDHWKVYVKASEV